MRQKEFNFALELLTRNPWLSGKEDSLATLIEKDCKSRSEKEVVSFLLENFTYLTSREYTKRVEKFILFFQKNPWGCSSENTTIAAIAVDRTPDSSHVFVQKLKYVFAKHDIHNATIVNGISRLHRYLGEHENVILVDEFIATGGTILGRIDLINRNFFNANKNPPNIYVYSIAAIESSIPPISVAAKGFEADLLLKKGLSELAVAKTREPYSEAMKGLEEILAEEFNGHQLPSFGHGQAEALFAIEESNAPNSNFPVFWWPRYRSQKFRKTLLYRFMPNERKR